MFGLEQTLKSSETRDFFDIEEQEKSLISRSLGMLQVGLEIFRYVYTYMEVYCVEYIIIQQYVKYRGVNKSERS